MIPLVIAVAMAGCGLKKISHRKGGGSGGSQDVQPIITPAPVATSEPEVTPRQVSSDFSDETFAACFGLDIQEIPPSEIPVEEAVKFCGSLTQIDFLAGVIENKVAIDVGD